MDSAHTSARKFLNNLGEIPSLPQLYYQIKKEVHDPYSSISRIAEVISVDQSLSVRILRLANSAFFGFPRRIETITDALSLIGLQQVRDLALSTMVVEMFGKVNSDLVDMNSFWRHSLACGICARVLAIHNKESNIERFFVAGLIHDVGRLIILIQDPVEAATIFKEAEERKELVYKVERERLSFDHGELGAELLALWQLPEPVIEAASYHHRPLRADRFQTEVGIVHFSDILVHSMDIGSSGERYVPTLVEEVWKRLDCRPDSIGHFIQEVDRQFSEVVSIILPSTPKPRPIGL